MHYLDVYVLHLCPELDSDDSGADCLLADECLLCFLCPYQGDSFSVEASSSPWPEDRTVSHPVDSLTCPDCLSGLTQTKQGYLVVVHLCCHLRCLLCFIHCVDVPGGHLGSCLRCQKGWGEWGEGGGLAASTRFSLQCVIHPVDEDPSTLKSGSFDLVIDVSVADLVKISSQEL